MFIIFQIIYIGLRLLGFCVFKNFSSTPGTDDIGCPMDVPRSTGVDHFDMFKYNTYSSIQSNAQPFMAG